MCCCNSDWSGMNLQYDENFHFFSSCISTLWFNMQKYVSINVFSLGLSCVTISWRIFYPRKTDCSLVLQVSSDMQPVSMLMILLLLET